MGGDWGRRDVRELGERGRRDIFVVHPAARAYPFLSRKDEDTIDAALLRLLSKKWDPGKAEPHWSWSLQPTGEVRTGITASNDPQSNTR